MYGIIAAAGVIALIIGTVAINWDPNDNIILSIEAQSFERQRGYPTPEKEVGYPLRCYI